MKNSRRQQREHSLACVQVGCSRARLHIVDGTDVHESLLVDGRVGANHIIGSWENPRTESSLNTVILMNSPAMLCHRRVKLTSPRMRVARPVRTGVD